MGKRNYFVLGDEEKIEVQSADIEQAQMNGVNLSVYLNNKYSQQVAKFNKEHNAELDAFDLALLSNGIVVRDNLELGIQSSNMEVFYRTDANKALFPEFIVRTLRQISGMPSILNDIVASTRVIEGDSMRGIYLDLSNTPQGNRNKKALKYRRIAEGADIPTATLKLGETSIRIYKYGIAVSTTYEVMRRTTIDMFRKQIELVSVQAQYDQVGTVIETILNGDGNNNAAQVFLATDLNEDAVEGKVDEVTLIKFLIKQTPFNFNTFLVDEDVYVQFVTMLMDKNLTNAVNPKVAFEFPQGLLSNLRIIYSEDLPETTDSKKQIIGLAKEYAIEKIVESGSIINETAKTITNQTQIATLTENAGFAKLDKRASAVLKLA